MNTEKVKEILKGDFIIKAWNKEGYDLIESNLYNLQLDTMIFNNLNEFLQLEYIQEIMSMLDLGSDDILNNEETFYDFLNNNINMDSENTLKYEDRGKPFMAISFIEGYNDYIQFEPLSKMNNENDVIEFINSVLNRSGWQVTNKDGLKPEFEIVNISE